MNKKKLTLIISITLILLVTILVTIYVINNKNKENNNISEEVKKVDEIKEYNYYLEEDATSYYKEVYNELKEVINKEEIDYKEYAINVSKLFVIDLFTLNNKISSNDVGGLQFIYPDFKDNFIKIAQTSLYSGIKNNIYGDRNQELPIVNNVNVIEINESTFSFNDTSYEAYEIKVGIEYEKDLEYPNEYKITLIKNDKYIQVVSGE